MFGVLTSPPILLSCRRGGGASKISKHNILHIGIGYLFSNNSTIFSVFYKMYSSFQSTPFSSRWGSLVRERTKFIGWGFIFAQMKKALIQLHIAVFLAGFTAILGKLITLNEGLLVWFRLFITVITLGAILYFRNQLLRIPFRDVLKIFGVGTIVAIHWVTFYGSVKYANVSVALVCFSATGFFTAFFEPFAATETALFTFDGASKAFLA